MTTDPRRPSLAVRYFDAPTTCVPFVSVGFEGLGVTSSYIVVADNRDELMALEYQLAIGLEAVRTAISHTTIQEQK